MSTFCQQVIATLIGSLAGFVLALVLFFVREWIVNRRAWKRILENMLLDLGLIDHGIWMAEDLAAKNISNPGPAKAEGVTSHLRRALEHGRWIDRAIEHGALLKRLTRKQVRELADVRDRCIALTSLAVITASAHGKLDLETGREKAAVLYEGVRDRAKELREHIDGVREMICATWQMSEKGPRPWYRNPVYIALVLSLVLNAVLLILLLRTAKG